MQRAGQWLRSVQREDGSWRDFWTPSGVSDEWVSGYAGASLALSSRDEERAGEKEAWQYLKSHARTPAGWGYSASVPRDADSTAWALLLAERIGEGGPLPSDEATAFLRRSQVPGGVSTYATAGDIREYVEATGCTDFCGWSAAHDCVTGTAAQVSVLRAALAPAILAANRTTARGKVTGGSRMPTPRPCPSQLSRTFLRQKLGVPSRAQGFGPN